ncbi:L-cysteine:1D-myo-inositol 2-amino-2-deoxy-alpha-D-glucopyranoside ligase [Tersicoccus solisilvae]|uniref:L-cysteine:1D-myo-inositol 2-amino-2-deoxy-alpha-D-glucopyranoside ligase n=1 Tax=Tersicoccus solisilvae TaxID=1882339 RepID=A0ABQ1P3B7_9MICC|nr:cysteine--1-D-myo-inosityl 2-amino-2-deoxy-alpha-D-glucopyranoside ligase [Tersicoccus solisilvae]GGC88112.1 L-cysteine:1D-myo-inositol 2-amino-2-deoxy-alpha-D-glucopyranoside ligase [Tersicoccus solisilvae]
MQSWPTPGLAPLEPLPGPVRLHDTAARRILPVELGEDRDGPVAGLYVCGITPYDATHLGHAATYLAFDLLVRQWRDTGAAVTYVQNVTDVDDPLLERADATGVDWRDLAAEQTDLFRADMTALRVLPPDHYIGAVEAVPWIVPAVEALVAAGVAYRVPGTAGEPDGDVYFDVEAARSTGWRVGALGGYGVDQLLTLFAERGGDPRRPGKRNPLDALLWRVAREGEPRWPGGVLGAGRPGWHIECSVIAERFLHTPFTVQGGGDDLIFPHHDFSAGHARALTGRPLARHFAHTGMVGFEGHKMSKSRGNLVLVSRLRESGVDPAAIRLAVLGQHYRSAWEYTDALLVAAEDRLARWRAAAVGAQTATGAAREDVDRADERLVERLRDRLRDDLDTPGALAAVDAWAATVLGGSRDAAAPAPNAEQQARVGLGARAVDALLGIDLSPVELAPEDPTRAGVTPRL